MKKIIAALVIIIFFFQSFAFAENQENNQTEKNNEILYPQGEDFSRLQKIISETFDKKTENSNPYYADCIKNNALCPNYKYTSISEKAIKLIIAKTFSGNEDFYKKLFLSNYAFVEGSSEQTFLTEVLRAVPR